MIAGKNRHDRILRPKRRRSADAPHKQQPLLEFQNRCCRLWTGHTLLRCISCIYLDRVPAIVSITKLRPLPLFRSVSDMPVKACPGASAVTLDFRGTKRGRQKASRSGVPKTLMPIDLRCGFDKKLISSPALVARAQRERERPTFM